MDTVSVKMQEGCQVNTLRLLYVVVLLDEHRYQLDNVVISSSASAVNLFNPLRNTSRQFPEELKVYVIYFMSMTSLVKNVQVFLYRVDFDT